MHTLGIGLVTFPMVLVGVVVRSAQISGLSATTGFCLTALLICVAVGLFARLGGERPESDDVLA
jgi:hypothetical protein